MCSLDAKGTRTSEKDIFGVAKSSCRIATGACIRECIVRKNINSQAVGLNRTANSELLIRSRISSPCRFAPVLEKILLICDLTVLSVTPTMFAIIRGAVLMRMPRSGREFVWAKIGVAGNPRVTHQLVP